MWLKVGLLALVLAVILYLDIVSPAAVGAAFAHPAIALSALALILLSAQLSVLRWHLLLRWQGSPLGIGQVWQISYISWFMGSLLPGAVGADALRALYVHRACPDTRVPGFLTILVDRLLGLVALLILILVLAAILSDRVLREPVLAAIAAVSALALVALAASMPLAAWISRRIVPALGRFPRIARLLGELAEAAAGTFAGWRKRPGSLLFALAIGVLSHVMVLAAIGLIARGIEVTTLSATEIGLAGGMAILANHLPLTPGGVGVGEISFAELCQLLEPGGGSPAYGSVIFAFRLITLLSYLPGGLALVTYRRDAAAKAASIAASTASTPSSSKAG